MFSTLTKPSYPKAALGFGDGKVTALSLKGAGQGRFGVRQAASLQIPEGLVTPGFSETNIARPYELESVLDRLTTECGLRGQKHWSVSLPSNAARTSILSISEIPSSRKELEEVIEFKAETSFGVASNQLRISVEKLAPIGDGKTRYFASAVTLDVIDEYESVFESLGWRAGLILPRAVCELRWLTDKFAHGDSLLISSQRNGFTALLVRGGQPALVRSVVCGSEEIDDEIYRLLVYYNDRYAGLEGNGALSNFLVVGDDGGMEERLKVISAEALGRPVDLLGPSDVGLELNGGGLSFSDIAAPAGAATFGWQ